MATANTSKKRRQQRRQAVVRLTIMAAILVCVNILASYFHRGLDLTKEGRFTLSQPTKKLLSNMKDVAVVNVYLKGKFPADFQRLQEVTREKLENFKEFAGDHLVFHFVDPFEGKNDDEVRALKEQFVKQEIVPVPIEQNNANDYSQTLVYPYAVVQYEGREKAVRLLEAHAAMSREEELGYSESLLEYNLASAIRDLSMPQRPAVAYLVGNGEPLHTPYKYDLFKTVAENYRLDTLDLANYYIPNAYNAIIISNPTIPFSDKDKFKIDQYVMNGGHVLWALNELYTPMDSLNVSSMFVTTDYGLNLDDILFKYGVRVNTDLIEDYECAEMPLVASGSGENAQMDFHKWVYFPIIYPTSKHPIVSNMGAILTKFPNSIDTITNPGIKKTILLESGKYSRTATSPTRVSFSILRFPMQPQMFNKPYRPLAVLLEGRFNSVFTNRIAPDVREMLEKVHTPFKQTCDSSNSMIVVSNGDIFSNDYSASRGPFEMGFYRYYNQGVFANKAFLLNCLEYLTDRTGLIEARSKNVTARLLDASRVDKEKTTWQIVNIGIPIAAVLVFASCYFFFRKRRYETRMDPVKSI